MLTVWSVLWGDKYSHYCVQRLQREVAKYLSIPHTFICLTNQDIEGVHTIRQVSDKPGWWQKIDLFCFRGPSLYFDLDVVPTGPLDAFVGTDAQVKTLKNWAASGHGGCQSSIMYWEDARIIWESFDDSIAHWPPINAPGVLWGDQEAITAMRDAGTLSVDYFPEHLAKSYKYHCQNGLPEPRPSAIVFHGDPKPGAVSVDWFQWT